MSQTVFVAPLTPARIKYGLFVLRVFVGIVFVMHGAQKVFQQTVPGVTQFFTQIGAPLPSVTAPLVAYLELGGGILLILGLLTPFVASLLALDMLGAIFLVHLPAGFFLTMQGADGYEFVLTLFAASVALALAGAGAFSLDDVFFKRSRSRN
jgi:putative oxidoreductase